MDANRADKDPEDNQGTSTNHHGKLTLPLPRTAREVLLCECVSVRVRVK